MPRKARLLSPKPLPCRFCGSQPKMRSVDICFVKDGTYITTQIEIECSNTDCDKEHRHFRPRATRREALNAWNKRNEIRT